ncbi:hypothetical protein A2U01_0102393, partial [Trifolium medium]|nr:hypothetical protein [Trifolium medium]
SCAIDLDSDGLSDEADADDDSQSLEFLKDLIVTPPTAPEKSGGKNDAGPAVERNLSKVFDGVAKRH